MKILFLFPYPLEQAPSQRFRFEQYFDLLLQHKHSIHTQSFWGGYSWSLLYKEGNFIAKVWGLVKGFGRRLQILAQIPGYDLIFIHRELTPIGPPVFEWIICRLLRKRVVYDFDDAIWLPNTSESNSMVAWLKWHHKTARICRCAWKVSAGNEFLAAYARRFNQNVIINPTTIDLSWHRVENRIINEPPVIGWTGSHSTLPYLDRLWPVLEKLQSEVPFTLKVIANQPPARTYPWLHFVRWDRETEIQELATFDIGLMPLPDDDWSRGKCGFKALQYMALGIATVASPVGVNSQIIGTGQNGILCDTDAEWHAALSALLQNALMRQKLGEAGMETVKLHYSIEANARNFLSLFTEA